MIIRSGNYVGKYAPWYWIPRIFRAGIGPLQLGVVLFLYRSKFLVSLYFHFYYIYFLSGSTFIAPVKCIWCWVYFLIYTLWNWIFFVCFSEFRPDRFLRMHNYFLYVLFSRSVLQMSIRNFPLVLMIWDCVMKKDLLLLGR